MGQDKKPDGNVRSGHTDSVTAIAFSPDGKTLVSGGEDNTIRIWNLATGKESLFVAQEDQFGFRTFGSVIAFGPDGKILAVGDRSGIHLMNLNASSGDAIKTIGEELSGIESIAFSPNGKTIAAAGDDDVHIWNVESGEEIFSLEKTHDPVVFSRDGKFLACGSGDDYIKLFDAATGKKIRSIEGAGNVSSLAFSSDGFYLASGGEKGKVWKVATGTEAANFKPPAKDVVVAANPIGRMLAFGTSNIQLVSVATGAELRRIDEESYNSVKLLAFSPDGKTLASVRESDKSIHLWNSATGKEIRVLAGHSISVQRVAFSPDDKSIFSGGYEGALIKWNVKSGEIEKVIAQLDKVGIESLSFSPDEKTLAVLSGGEYSFFDPITGNRTKTDPLAFHPKGNIFSPDWKYTAYAFDLITIYDYSSGEEIRKLLPQTSETVLIQSATFSPDSSSIAAIVPGQGIKIWELKTGRIVRSIRAEFSYGDILVFSPDGKTILGGGRNDKAESYVKIWDASTGALLNSIEKQGARAVFNRDGTLLAVSDYGDKINLIELNSGKTIRTFEAIAYASVYSVEFSHDGTTLAAATGDGVKLFDVATGKELRILK